MSIVPPVRPPPSAAAPDDFDAAMAARWAAWNARGRLEAARGRRDLCLLLVAAGSASLAGYLITTLLSR